MNKNIKISFVWSMLTVFLMISCYDEFDPNTYKPAFTISGFTSSEQIESGALVAYFPFDGALTEVKTSSEAENTATTFAKAFKNQGLSLNVANKSYVTYDPGSMLTDLESFTFSFWVNPTFIDANSDNGIDGILGFINVSNANDFWGYLDWFVENGSNNDAAKIVVHIKNAGGGDSWLTIEGYKGLFGNWTNHTLTYDATTSTLNYYINGALLKTATAGWTGPISFEGSGKMVFGTVHFQTEPTLSNHGSEPWASWLTGSLDELRIYNKALTQEQINALVVLQGKGK